jgi:hypothetical protein
VEDPNGKLYQEYKNFWRKVALGNIIINLASYFAYYLLTKKAADIIEERLDALAIQDSTYAYKTVRSSFQILRSLYYVDFFLNIFFLQTVNHFMHADKSDKEKNANLNFLYVIYVVYFIICIWFAYLG